MSPGQLKKEFRKEFEAGELHRKWSGACGHDGYLSKWASHRMEVALRLIDSLGLGKSGGSADIGIGSGRLLRELSERGSTAYGFDFSYEIARRNIGKAPGPDMAGFSRLAVADIESLPIKSGSLDLVTSLGVLEYLRDDGMALQELYRVLKPGGHLVLAVASYHRFGSIMGLLKKKLFRNKMAGKNGPTDVSLDFKVRLIKPLDLKRETVRAGFKVRKFKCFGGRVLGMYFPFGISVPGLVYLGDHCMLVLEKPCK